MNFIYGLVCLLATVAGSISGIGGGIIIKPVMDAVSGMQVAQISFLSGCTVLAMSVVSLLRSKGDSTKVEPRRGTLLAVGAAVGGLGGKWLFDLVLGKVGNGKAVSVIQSVVLVLLTVGVLIYVLKKAQIKTKMVQNWVLCVLIGLVLGVFSSFLGIGGGPVNLVVLYYFFSMDTKAAALSSIYIILFSQIASLASTFVTGRVPEVELLTLAVMVICGVLGGMLGRTLNRKMSASQVDKLFLLLLVIIIGISIYNIF